MAADRSLLDNVRVASPCSAAWDRMDGDERYRFCRECGKNVYNLSSLSRAEAEALVREKEGRLCVRFYRRRDGTVLTRIARWGCSGRAAGWSSRSAGSRRRSAWSPCSHPWLARTRSGSSATRAWRRSSRSAPSWSGWTTCRKGRGSASSCRAVPHRLGVGGPDAPGGRRRNGGSGLPSPSVKQGPGGGS